MIELHTPHLCLREFLPEDYPAMYVLYADPAVTRFTGEPPFDSVEAVASAFADYPARNYLRNGTGRLTVIEKATGTYVGWCGLKTLEDGEIDIDFRFMPAFWGQGYGFEAAQACIRYGFEVLRLAAIRSDALADNAASIALKKKLGMIFAGPFSIEGKPGVLYRITREEYLANHSAQA